MSAKKLSYQKIKNVKQLLATGTGVSEIARRHKMSPSTVENIKKGIYDDRVYEQPEGPRCSVHEAINCVECFARTYAGPPAVEFDDEDPVMAARIKERCAYFRRKKPRQPEYDGTEPPQPWTVPSVHLVVDLDYSHLAEVYE